LLSAPRFCSRPVPLRQPTTWSSPTVTSWILKAAFRKYQRDNPSDEVIIHAIPQDAFEAALKTPDTMIISAAGETAGGARTGDEEQRPGAGADADLTIFDPNTVVDAASDEDPARYSEGFRYVFVAGVPVVVEGKLQSAVAPGRPVRTAIQ
jgi:hypothetical protein